MREVAESSSYAGLWLGIIILPMLFIMTLMIGVLCGLRKTDENGNDDGGDQSSGAELVDSSEVQSHKSPN
jgi:hypothetical protein